MSFYLPEIIYKGQSSILFLSLYTHTLQNEWQRLHHLIWRGMFAGIYQTKLELNHNHKQIISVSSTLNFIFKDFCWACAVIYLLVDAAVRRPMVDEDTDDVHVSPPGGQVQWEATFAVRHICGGFKLKQLQNHIPETGADTKIHRSMRGETEKTNTEIYTKNIITFSQKTALNPNFTQKYCKFTFRKYCWWNNLNVAAVLEV